MEFSCVIILGVQISFPNSRSFSEIKNLCYFFHVPRDTTFSSSGAQIVSPASTPDLLLTGTQKINGDANDASRASYRSKLSLRTENWQKCEQYSRKIVIKAAALFFFFLVIFIIFIINLVRNK